LAAIIPHKANPSSPTPPFSAELRELYGLPVTGLRKVSRAKGIFLEHITQPLQHFDAEKTT
jgi:hypothetical protein